MPAYIRLDLFPATVIMPDSTSFDPARVVVTDDTLYVFIEGNLPQPVVELKLYDYEAISRNRYRVITDGDEQEIILTKRAGCGCGNRLRGFRPFPGVPLLRK